MTSASPGKTWHTFPPLHSVFLLPFCAWSEERAPAQTCAEQHLSEGQPVRPERGAQCVMWDCGAVAILCVSPGEYRVQVEREGPGEEPIRYEWDFSVVDGEEQPSAALGAG